MRCAGWGGGEWDAEQVKSMEAGSGEAAKVAVSAEHWVLSGSWYV